MQDLQKDNAERISMIREFQAERWREFLKSNPDRVFKYKLKITWMNSDRWRKYLKRKAEKHIGDHGRIRIELPPAMLRIILDENVG